LKLESKAIPGTLLTEPGNCKGSQGNRQGN
jgi:hypothetical protein